MSVLRVPPWDFRQVNFPLWDIEKGKMLESVRLMDFHLVTPAVLQSLNSRMKNFLENFHRLDFLLDAILVGFHWKDSRWGLM